jgi:hypothetical protein
VLENATEAVPGGRCVASCIGQPPLPKPGKPGSPLELNGQPWPQLCIDKSSAHFFGIGDWGGIGAPGDTWTNPGKCVDPPAKGRPCTGADKRAQYFVARQMKRVAPTSKPDYVINVGDNFYPGGVLPNCGKDGRSGQWSNQFDKVYNDAGSPLVGLPWHGVLGNHDYGGTSFDAGWDHQIMETWNRDNWIMPGQYWSRTVQYQDFAVEYFFLESNYQDGNVPDPGHLICQGDGECLGMNKDTCFNDLMKAYVESKNMLEAGLKKSTAEWHIVVTHFPAQSFVGDPWFQQMNEQYGIDLILTGHSHKQHTGNDHGMQWIITGGGGGVTSDDPPDYPRGNDTAYGFVDFAINRTHLTYDMHTWGGNRTAEGDIIIHSSAVVPAHQKKVPPQEVVV